MKDFEIGMSCAYGLQHEDLSSEEEYERRLMEIWSR